MVLAMAKLATALVFVTSTHAIDNGLGRTPPMGWRSWNAYHSNINQDKMTTAANMMVDKSRGLSLLDVGFNNCGLDDYYQACGTGANGSFHNASGYPMIDHTKFPDMKAMTDHAHSIGLRMGWYGNNCGCNEHQHVPSWGPSPGGSSTQGDGIYHYQGDVQATIDFGFDGIKLDGCGEFRNLSYFAELMNKTGRPILVEDCHWGGDGPGDWGDGGSLNQGPNKVSPENWCPFNFFRTSGDIGSNWGSVMRNLQTVIKHQPWGNMSAVRTGPGCWAYPDMLEVGNLASFEEDRAHFGAWCIVSAPLILGHDLNNSATNDRIWPIVTNKAAISVSQSFAEGDKMHPGSFVKGFNPPPAPGPPEPPVQYLWGEKTMLPDQWDVPASGTIGTVKHTPSNTCIDASLSPSQAKEIELQACNSSSPSQQFQLDATTGELHLNSVDGKMCLAVENFDGPGVVWYTCNTGSNEEFIINNGALCSKGGYCLTAKPTSPSQQPSSNFAIQFWAKPQPNNAMAVLIINDSGPNTTQKVDFADYGFTSSGATSILDIWTGKTTQLAAGATSYTTDVFGPHDSRFYLLSHA